MSVFGGVPPTGAGEMGNASGNRTETTSVSVTQAIRGETHVTNVSINASGNRTETTSVSVTQAIQGETRVKNVSLNVCCILHILTKLSSNMYTKKLVDL